VDLDKLINFIDFQSMLIKTSSSGNLEQFRNALDELTQRKSSFYLAWLFLARVNTRLGNIEKAEIAYRKVLVLCDKQMGNDNNLKLAESEINTFAQRYSRKGLIDDLKKTFVNIHSDTKKLSNINIKNEFHQTTKEIVLTSTENRQQAIELQKSGNKEASKGNPERALKYFSRAEELFAEPNPTLFKSMANAALAIKDTKIGNAIALHAIDKGIMCKNATDDDLFVFCYLKSQLLRREQDWEKLVNTYQELYSLSKNKSRRINAIVGLIEAYAKLGNFVKGMEWTNELLTIDPANTMGKKMLSQFQTYANKDYDEETIEELGDEVSVEIAQSLKIEVSPMLQIDVIEAKYTDPEIIKRGGKPIADDAFRLLREADRALERALREKKELFVSYPLYLEAAKAFFNLPRESYKEEDYHHSLSRYSSLRAGALFNDLKIEYSAKDSKVNFDKIRKLHDGAASYYLESLRLKLDENDVIVGQIINDYIKLFYLDSLIKKEIKPNHSIFTESFRATATKCIEESDTTISLCNALLNVGAANPENFNKIFSKVGSGNRPILRGAPRNVIFENRKIIIDGMVALTDINRDEIKGMGKLLRKLFDYRRKEIISLKQKLSGRAEIPFNAQKISHIFEDWTTIAQSENILHNSDYQILIEMSDIIEKLKPYLELSQPEKVALISFLSEKINELLERLQIYPTYWGRAGFSSILQSWNNSLYQLERSRDHSIQPQLIVNVDPPYLVVMSNEASISMTFQNTGAATAEAVCCHFIVGGEENTHIILEDTQVITSKISPGDFVNFSLNLNKADLDTATLQTIHLTLEVKIKHRDQNLSFHQEFTLSVEQSRKITLDEIPWNETGHVSQELFKGRDEIINKLEKHYLSRNRIETYVLYGLTRHGKSSIHRFLSERLCSKIVETDNGPKRFLPFDWSFATAASRGNASDMWDYFVKDKILEKLDVYIQKSIISKKIYENGIIRQYMGREKYFRNSRFHKLLWALNEEGYLPFIAIDEFTYYTQMIDSNMIRPSFLQEIREITIDEKLACFIFAGIYDLVEIFKDSKYGITSQFANTIQYQVGPIDDQAADDIITIISDKLKFTKEAIAHIKIASNNIPHFIQMICRRCGWYAVATGRNVIGLPEVDLVISTLAGERKQELPGDVRPLEGQFRDTQYRTNELVNNAVISTIALKNIGLRVPRFISREEMIQIWGAHRSSKEYPAGQLGNFLPKLTNSIQTLKERGVLIEDRSDGVPTFKIGVDLFRRWWAVQYPSLESELDKLIGYRESHYE